MASYVPIIKNGASGAIFYLGLQSFSGVGFQANPTLAAGDVKIAKDGGALANLTTLPAVTPAASKLVKVTLSQTETNADNVTIIFSDQTSPAEWCDTIVNLQTAARQFDTLSTQISVDDLPTNAELTTALANLPTDAELATALGTADDAILAAVAALNNLSQVDIRTAVGLSSPNLATLLAAITTKTDSLTFTIPGVVNSNIKYVADDQITGAGTALDNWRPV